MLFTVVRLNSGLNFNFKINFNLHVVSFLFKRFVEVIAVFFYLEFYLKNKICTNINDYTTRNF